MVLSAYQIEGIGLTANQRARSEGQSKSYFGKYEFETKLLHASDEYDNRFLP